MSLIDWAGRRMFSLVHQHHLVYNTCWEDPRLDREALAIRPTDTVLVITSAGCNALD
jgi:S-adenosylmethionine-diacylglycerol 3-amino-3-carboxypropyl transferase